MWIVKFGNYYPEEIDSYHRTEKSAENRCNELNYAEYNDASMWKVEKI